VLTLKDQLKEYQYRGEAMNSLNFIKFMLDTYEGKILRSDNTQENDPIESTRVGRPANLRVPYKSEYGKPTRARVFRTAGHETLPRFIGKWFERKDDPITKELYYASMLLLLKPWNNLSELKSQENSFEESWVDFSHDLDEFGRTFTANVDYYYECMDNAKARREEGYPSNSEYMEFEDDLEDVEDPINTDIQDDYMDITLSEDDVDFARKQKHEPREQLQAEIAMNIANDIGVFKMPINGQENSEKSIANKASQELLDEIRKWESHIKSYKRQIVIMQANSAEGSSQPSITQSNISSVLATTESLPSINRANAAPQDGHIQSSRLNDTRPLYNLLNEDQKRAHDIVYNVLLQHLQGMFCLRDSLNFTYSLIVFIF
jgi:hypothetical protein